MSDKIQDETELQPLVYDNKGNYRILHAYRIHGNIMYAVNIPIKPE